ncbi:hypothetical protein ACLQ2Q_15700 [Microbacterium sp. DT81.1]|uniref:hypothetical protein n=1 Tax=Microbacterium sp. DT81.1 TaxID=3393413 RepID=UPI003CF35DC5
MAYVVLGCLLLWLAPEPLLNNWLPGSTVEERGRLLGTAAQVILLGLGGLIAIVGVALSLSRHRQELEAAERDRQRLVDDRHKEATRRDESEEQRLLNIERELRARFVTAVDLIGSDLAIRRTAAIYALGALADDWDDHGRRDEVQVCVDVICAYLRAPSPGPESSTPRDEVEIKTTAYRLIRAHMQPGANRSWSTLKLDLNRARIDFGVDLDSIVITGSGQLSFANATIRNNIWMNWATISDGGRLSLRGASIRSGAIWLGSATITRAYQISFDHTDFKDQGRLHLHGATISDGEELDMRTTFFDDESNLQMDEPLVALDHVGTDRDRPG